MPDDLITTSPFQKCLAFSTIFYKNSILDNSNAPAPPPPNTPPSKFMYLPITSPRRVRRALSKLDVTKAYGWDGIQPSILRECASELSPVISRLFRLIIKTNVLPLSWSIRWYSPSQRAFFLKSFFFQMSGVEILNWGLN